MSQSGFINTWNAYQCALHGHMWTWRDSNTVRLTAPSGASCQRCGAVKS